MAIQPGANFQLLSETREAKSALLGKVERVCTVHTVHGEGKGRETGILEGKLKNNHVNLFYFGQSKAISIIRKGLNMIRSDKFGN